MKGGDFPLADVVRVSAAVASTTSRSRKIALLAELIAAVPVERVGGVVRVLTGTIPAPALGVGPARLMASRPGDAARESTLTLGALERRLVEVAATEGSGSVERKIALLGTLLARATADEQSFILRLCLGELRQGALEGVMVDAVARAFDVPAERVRRAHMLSGDLAETARLAASGDANALSRIGLRLFRPVAPMLSSSADSLDEALARHGRTLLEWKLDGARIQAHKDGSRVRVFTRALRDVTAALPEVVDVVAGLPARSAVLDGEAIALHPDGRPRPFQVTMSRFGADATAPDLFGPEVELTPYFFDVLLVDGETLIDRPLRERRKALRALVPPHHVLPSLETDAPAEAGAFLAEARDAGHEGLMAKDPDSSYDAGRRGKGWLKIKPARTLDLVVLAVERGSGRRSGWWSNIHLGARDEETGDFVMLGKTFKGMTDETLRWQTETFPAYERRREGHVMYLEPSVVAEIAFNEIQRSRRYPGGLALRFARLVRYRTDKAPAEADTIQTVRAMFAVDTGEVPPR